MANGVAFEGANKVYAAPPGRPDVVDAHVFSNGHCIVTCWELTAEELAEVNRTGKVFVSNLSGRVMYPVFAGSESVVAELVGQYGKTWAPATSEPSPPPTAEDHCEAVRG